MNCSRIFLYLTFISVSAMYSLVNSEASLDLPVEEYVFSKWYYLDFNWSNGSGPDCLVDMSRVVSEISESLSKKLSVPAPLLIISILPNSSSSQLSINMSLSQHNIPGLHYRLCDLQTEYPIFSICRKDLELIKVRHGREQHLYIRNMEVIPYWSQAW